MVHEFNFDEETETFKSSNPIRWRLLCDVCEDYVSDLAESEPVVCPICSSESISEQTQQRPYLSDVSPDGTVWDHFTEDDGTIIVARRPSSA